jgi:hypothetical protein
MFNTQGITFPKDITYSHAMTDVSERVNIAVKKQTYFRLRSLGQMGQSFDSLISKVLDEYGNTEKENTVSESGSDLGRDLDQIPTTEGADYNSLAR